MEFLPRQARNSMAPAIETFINNVGLDIDLEAFKSDRRALNVNSGRPSKYYIAYWTTTQRIVEGTLHDIAAEIGCTVQALYTQRNAAHTAHGEDAPFYKLTQNGHLEHVMIQSLSDTAKEIISKRIAEFQDNLNKASVLYTEDGSY